MVQLRNRLVPTALVAFLAINHLGLGGHLAVDFIVIGCVGIYYTLFPPSGSR